MNTYVSEENLLTFVIAAFGLAAVITILLTPLSIFIANKIGAIDIPKDGRRMHARPIPRFGGMAIYIASTLVIVIFERSDYLIKVAMLGGTLTYVLGAIDDVFQLKAWMKFIGQTAIAVLMYSMGIKIAFISNYFGSGNLSFGGGLSFLITILWIVGVTNAINLMDGLDGLASGISMIIAVTLAYIAYIHGDNGIVPVCIALIAIAGACMGFLPYNFSPAKTFMGDGGALYLGFMISILSVISPLKRATFIAALVPIMALSIPIIDTLFAIVRRAAKCEGIMSPDKEHIHHRIIKAGFGHRRSVLIIYGIVANMGMAAIMISRELYKEAVCLFIISILYLVVILARKKTPNQGLKVSEEKVKDTKEGNN